jgi:hypothetical protein
MTEWELDQRTLAEEAVRAALPEETALAVVECDAFGAVVGKLFRASQAGADRTEVLASLDSSDIAFAAEATTPAAFLASRIQY